MGLQRVGHDWVANAHMHTYSIKNSVEYGCTYGWFLLMYDKKTQNSVMGINILQLKK